MITDVVVEPVDQTVLIDTQLQYTATALTSDNRPFDVTANSAWNSTSADVAEVSADGLVFAIAAGATKIQATYTHEGIATTGSTNLAVEAPLTLIAVNVEPVSAEVLVKASISYTAWATFSDSSRDNITTQAAWRSADTAVAVVGSGSDGGATTGVEAGTTQIFADYEYQGQTFDCQAAVGCAATVTVTDPVTIRAIQVTPANQEISVGNTEQYKAEAIFSDDSVLDVTTTAAWSSSESDKLALEEPTGLFRGVSPGSAVVSANVVFDGQNVSGQTSATVLEVPVIVERLVIEPVHGSVFVGNTLQYTATAYRSDDSHEDVTNGVTWLSDKQDIAVIGSGTGLATGRAAGIAGISAVWQDENGEISEQVDLEVKPAQATYLAIEPQDLASPAGYDIQYTAELHFSDGSSSPVTDNVTWSSSDEGVASIGNAPGNEGNARTLSVGITTISALHGESGVGNSTGLEVSAVTIMGLTISPEEGLSLPAGTMENLTAQASYSDGTVDDVTDRAQWSTTHAQIATVSNAANGNPGGIVTGVQTGSTNATAVFESLSANTSVEVTQAALESLDIKPESAQLQVGSTVAFTAEARFADGSSQIVTEDLTWQTDETDIAVISNDQSSAGVLTARADGSTTVRAFYETQPVGDTPSVTVIPKQAIAVTVYYNRLPRRPSEINEINEDKDIPIQFIAVATYGDGLVEDVTMDALWSLERVNSGDGPDANISQSGQVTPEKKNEDGRSLDVVANFDGLVDKAELVISDICEYRKKDVRLLEMALVPGDSSMAPSTQLRMLAQGYYEEEPGSDKKCVAPVLNDRDTDPRQPLSWEVSSGSAVTVDDDGVIFAQECGVSVVTATKQKEEDSGLVDYQASATITVDCP